MSCIDCHKCPEYHDETIGDIYEMGQAVKWLREGKLWMAAEAIDLHLVRLNKRHNYVTSRVDNEKV